MFKKILRRSLIISCAITLFVEAFNLLMYATEGDIIGFVYPGGEIVQKSLLGLLYSHYYPETGINEPYTGPHTALSFNIIAFLGGFLLIFAVILAISAMIGRASCGRKTK